MGLEIFTANVAGSEGALDVAEINELTRGMDPKERMAFVLDLVNTVKGIGNDPSRLRAYLDQKRQILVNRRKAVGDKFTASSVSLGAFTLSASDRAAAYKVINNIGGDIYMNQKGQSAADVLDIVLDYLPWAAIAKLLKGLFKWMLKFFPGLVKGSLDDFARGAVKNWNKLGIGQKAQKLGIGCDNSFSANTKVWVSRASEALRKPSSALARVKSIPSELALKAQKVAKTVLTAVAISSITIGTQVLAHNEQTKLETPQEVTNTINHTDPITVKLTLETSNGKLEVIEATPNHPFYALLEPNKNAQGTWVNAGELEPNNWLRRANGDYGVVKKLEWLTVTKQMYNLSVARDHTFFVGDGQWLVHNCGWTSPAGIVYNLGSREGNRVLHVFEHLAENPNKPLHTVFNVGTSSELLPLLDEAWLTKGAYTVDPRSGNWIYDIPMGRSVGTGGQQTIRIVVKPNSSELVTAFPR